MMGLFNQDNQETAMQTLPPEVTAPRISRSSPNYDPDADAERRRLIAEVAYSLGVRRGFEGGIEQALHDWVEAEKIVALRNGEESDFRV